ncbi:hypothetical protein NECAME_09267 [Necator americanus]|uniref:Uncharacterized protein n=1 Tax=Necator americanus TaxID=51031 RepID=W2TFG7_NECAM|nr:hypothetical protein NECAME_09267 [Necator americanus]ETN80329.1 hypothetical protein NECAME_09267 [Necator americanus]
MKFQEEGMKMQKRILRSRVYRLKLQETTTSSIACHERLSASGNFRPQNDNETVDEFVSNWKGPLNIPPPPPPPLPGSKPRTPKRGNFQRIKRY